jgi:hypothetical protein
MNGYTGFKFGEAKPYSPFSGGGSTFTGAKPPAYLSGLASFASPEEWETQGTAFIQNPQMLEKRMQLSQLGRQNQFEMAAMGDPIQAGQRAYTLGRESEEFNRLKMSAEAKRLQDQMAFQPQMEAIRSGIMSRMAGSLGISLPQASRPYQSGTGYNPTRMSGFSPNYSTSQQQQRPPSMGALSTMSGGPQPAGGLMGGQPSWMQSYQPPQFPRY